MIVTYSNDARVVYKKNLASTSTQVLIDCEPNEVKTLESMMVSCGTASTFTLIYNDGTTDFYIYNTVAMADNTTLFITDFHPKLTHVNGTGSQSLKIKAGDANRISVVAVSIDSFPTKVMGFPGAYVPGTGGSMTGRESR